MRTFHKYSGAGNDFFLFEDFSEDFPLTKIPQLCRCPLGEGADGVILLHRSGLGDFKMSYYNADGSNASMCGNGLRCFVHFLRDLGYLQEEYTIEVGRQLLTVKYKEGKISTFIPLPSIEIQTLCFDFGKGYLTHTGVPHLVLFPEGEVDVAHLGKKLREDPQFGAEGTNVNFVWKRAGSEMKIRTYERGVERETLACGTGAAAAAFVGYRLGLCDPSVRLYVQSGQFLEVRIGTSLEIIGPSERIAKGSSTNYA